MKAVVQRCREARVEVDGEIAGRIMRGLVVFLGVEKGDDETGARKLAHKVASLRIFDDAAGRFHFCVRDVEQGGVLVVSNFTLCGDARKGARPNFSGAALPAEANRLYECFVKLLASEGVEVRTGVFAAAMQVTVENDGPVTLLLESVPAAASS